MADVVMQNSGSQVEDAKSHFTAFTQEHPVSTTAEEQAITA